MSSSSGPLFVEQSTSTAVGGAQTEEGRPPHRQLPREASERSTPSSDDPRQWAGAIPEREQRRNTALCVREQGKRQVSEQGRRQVNEQGPSDSRLAESQRKVRGEKGSASR